MPLSARAIAWLATLSRETPMPTADVERLILAAGGTPNEAWLAFQDAYAGYIEEIGPGEIAIWGLARTASASPPATWFKTNCISIVPPEYGFPEAILCADVHPVHGYELGADGAFRGIGGPTDTFEMKIERHGLMREFYSRGKVTQTLLTRKADEPQHQRLLADMAHALVPEASNATGKFYLEAKRLLQYNPFIKQLILREFDVV